MIARSRWFCVALVLVATLSSASFGQEVRTERYDLPEADLSLFGKEFVLDYFFPAIDGEIVATRFNYTVTVDENSGFDASKIGLILQPPVDDPLDPDDRVLTLFQTGADFGWSGTGDFTYVATTDALNGPVLDFPPGTFAMLYGVTFFHADRLVDPDTESPLGGHFTASAIEVDYVVVPEPSTIGLAGMGLLVLAGATPRPHLPLRNRPSGRRCRF